MRTSVANQQRMTTAVRDLESTAGMVQAAGPMVAPVLKPILWSVLGFFTGFGGGDSGAGSGGGRGKGGLIGKLLSFIRDTTTSVLGGLAGAMIGDRLTGAAEESDNHEQDVADAEDSLDWGDELFDDIQQQCADAVESCVSTAVPMAQALIAAAAAAGEPQATQLRMLAVQLLSTAGESVCTMVEGRNESLSECMDFMIQRCTPAAQEGNCSVPLADAPAPAVTAAASEAAEVPPSSGVVETAPAGMAASAVSAPAVSAAAGSAATAAVPPVISGQVPAAPNILTQAASLGAGLAAAAGAGVVSSGPPPAPTLPTLPTLPDIVGNVQQAVDTAITTAVETVTQVVTPVTGDCPVPPVECEPAACEPAESVPEDCDTDGHTDDDLGDDPPPEVIPAGEESPENTEDAGVDKSAVDKTGFDKSGFDKSGVLPDAAVDHASHPVEPDPPAPTSTGDVDAAPSGEADGTDEAEGTAASRESVPSHPGWSPEVWSTEKAGESPDTAPEVTVERSDQW